MDYRQKITEEAAVMFRTYGIRAVTMDMLANHMGISKRTIYEVFKDKDELLNGVIKWMTLKQSEVMTRFMNESGNVIEAIFKMLDLVGDHFSKMSPAFQMDIKNWHKKMFNYTKEIDYLPYYRNNSEIIARGIKEGVFRNDIDVEITNKCLLEVVRMSNDNDIFSTEEIVGKGCYQKFLHKLSEGDLYPKGS